MDYTVMQYDQRHKVGVQTNKKMFGQGVLTHLHERDNTSYNTTCTVVLC
jgi:hypothetical protein